MNQLIKLCFYLWLAISSLMVWYTNDMSVAGVISRVWLCMLAFIGGVAGIAIMIWNEVHNHG